MSSPGERPDATREPAGERADELERLRALVGPNEDSYRELREQLERAGDAAREAELENGRLRGRLTQMEIDLHRARQDQYHIQRILGRPVRVLARGLRRVRR